MTPSAAPRAATAFCSFGVISCDTSAVEMSAAISRRSMTLTVTVFPCSAARAVARSAVRSASSLVADGSLVPALTTTSLNCLASAGRFIGRTSLVLVVGRRGGLADQLQADRFEFLQLAGGQPGGHGPGDAAGVRAPDLALQGAAR